MTIVAGSHPDRPQTYLLHLWRAKSQGKWQWRASIESPRSGERQLFACLEQLFAYLSEKCESQVPGDGDAERG